MNNISLFATTVKIIGRVIRECRKRMKKKEKQRRDPSLQNTNPSTFKGFAPCAQCQRANHPSEKCWSGPYAANRHKPVEKHQLTDSPQEDKNKEV